MKKRKICKLIILAVTAVCMLFVFSSCAALTGGDTADAPAASASAGTGTTGTDGDAAADDATTGTDDAGLLGGLLGSRSTAIQLVGLLTILSIAPSILLMMTSFTRIVVVLSFTRNALGLQQMPPNQVLVALAVFLTFFVMAPVFQTIQTNALEPYLAGDIDLTEAVDEAEGPIRDFMLMQTYSEDMEMFMGFSNVPAGTNVDDIPMTTIIPAFITSELKRGFIIGFFIYIPFIVVDMVVASTLMAMGMMMLPPITISLPFKVLLFVLVDGWTLTVDTLLQTYNAFT